MIAFRVKLACLKGHTQEIDLHGFSLERAHDFAEMVSGRSRFFVTPIPEDAVEDQTGARGFCGKCGHRITAPVVSRVELPNAPLPPANGVG